MELDKRLVDSCVRNIEINGLTEFVSCEKGDAGSVARRIMRSRERRRTAGKEGGGERAAEVVSGGLTGTEFDVLLVDPPRQGLDSRVIDLAVNSGIQRLLYVSCGREALKRDLAMLGSEFEVVNMLLTDLFPRTDSVETLVHLKRREVKKQTEGEGGEAVFNAS